MKSRKILAFRIWFFFCILIPNLLFAAENSTLTLNFGGSPGDAIAHSYDYGTPENAGETYTMRIPVIYKELAAALYDTKVTVRSADKVVLRVEAVRAYKSLSDCNDGLEIVTERLSKGLPTAYAGGEGSWQYQSPDGRVVGRAVCDKERRRPFFTLQLDIQLVE
ncbi:MAG: hypothetical protein AAF387_02120 [Pseudomonadota bacterium]